jgi:GAF domain-containing protein
MEREPRDSRLPADIAEALAASPDVAAIAERLSGGGVLLAPRSVPCVWTLEGDRLRLRAVAGAAAPAVASSDTTLALGEGIAGRIALQGSSLVAGELVGDAAAPTPGFLAGGEFRSFVGTTLTVGERTEGVLVVYLPPSGSLDDAHLAIIRGLADLAALGLSNARHNIENEVYRRWTARRVEATQSLVEHGQLLARSIGLSEITPRIVANVSRLLGGLLAMLFGVDPVSGEVTLMDASTPLLTPGLSLKEGTGLVGIAVRERRVVTTTDNLKDPRITYEPELRAQIGLFRLLCG